MHFNFYCQALEIHILQIDGNMPVGKRKDTTDWILIIETFWSRTCLKLEHNYKEWFHRNFLQRYHFLILFSCLFVCSFIHSFILYLFIWILFIYFCFILFLSECRKKKRETINLFPPFWGGFPARFPNFHLWILMQCFQCHGHIKY